MDELQRYDNCSNVRVYVGNLPEPGLCQLLYLGLPLVCLLHIEEAQALAPRQGSSPWGGAVPADQCRDRSTSNLATTASLYAASI
jgi:hypothetical protein